MDKEKALKLIKSRVKAKRRKGLRFIVGNLKHFEDKRKIFDLVKEMLTDEEWSVRTLALKGLAGIAIYSEDFLNDAVETLKNALKDENENVRGAAIDNLARLLKAKKIINDAVVEEFISTGLSDEKITVVNSALRLLKYASRNNIKNVSDYITNLQELLDRIDNTYTRLQIIGLLTETFNNLEEKLRTALIEELKDTVRREEVHYKVIALNIIDKLLDAKAIAEPEIRDILIKRLRDNANAAKLAVINIIWEAAKRDPSILKPYLEIIIWEIMTKTRNNKLRLHILKFLEETLANLPRDMVNKYDIARALDILEKNTVPKSAILREIKIKSKEILETKIGLNLEERIKKI